MSTDPIIVAPTRGRPTNAVRESRRVDGLFWVARQILRADTDAQRAQILLRLPDLLLTQKSDVLREACTACGFADGAAYIAVRAAACSATRDERGGLPAAELGVLEFWRRGMVAAAHQSAEASL